MLHVLQVGYQSLAYPLRKMDVLHVFGCTHEHRHPVYSTRVYLRGESVTGRHTVPSALLPRATFLSYAAEEFDWPIFPMMANRVFPPKLYSDTDYVARVGRDSPALALPVFPCPLLD